VLEGRSIAASTEAELTARATAIKEATGGRVPILATILVGDDPASTTYVRMKGNACRRIGLESRPIELPASTTTEELLAQIDLLNDDPDVHGILLQHPVPSHVDERAGFDRIELAKDVDGVTALGFGRMSLGEPAFGSATPAGIMRLLSHYDIDIQGQHAVVIGRSPILGKPVAAMLLNDNATVTVCHSRTQRLPEIVRTADLLVAAVGRPRFVKDDWVQDGAIVVDAGYHPAEQCGDVDLDPIAPRTRAYTPVPGGVGPMTISTLILQTVVAAERAAGIA
jgi:methylenetetrahydrofolate dehydrogenase (NADP+)/methenyltetrahydrofolate cyclohydrolase